MSLMGVGLGVSSGTGHSRHRLSTAGVCPRRPQAIHTLFVVVPSVILVEIAQAD